MSEPSPIVCDLRNLISEATQVLILNKKINTLSEYVNIEQRNPLCLSKMMNLQLNHS